MRLYRFLRTSRAVWRMFARKSSKQQRPRTIFLVDAGNSEFDYNHIGFEVRRVKPLKIRT